MGALNEISGRYAAGLLGYPLLWPYRVHMDFKAGRLILERYPASRADGSARAALRAAGRATAPGS
jgi:hypothetical protein